MMSLDEFNRKTKGRTFFQIADGEQLGEDQINGVTVIPIASISKIQIIHTEDD